jgi:hypothetical protein
MGGKWVAWEKGKRCFLRDFVRIGKKSDERCSSTLGRFWPFFDRQSTSNGSEKPSFGAKKPFLVQFCARRRENQSGYREQEEREELGEYGSLSGEIFGDWGHDVLPSLCACRRIFSYRISYELCWMEAR